MKTLADVMDKLDEMDVEPDEIKISRATFNYLVEKAKEILAKEEAEDD